MGRSLRGTTGGEERDGFLASVEKSQRFPETSPLRRSVNPVVGASHTGTLAERDRDKVTLPDPAVHADWSRAPDTAGMSGATQNPKRWLFPD